MTELYYVKVKCHHMSFKALVDCGANISIISTTMLQKCGLHTNLKTMGYVHGVSGKNKMIGHVDRCPILLAHRPPLLCHVDFVVVDNTNLIILGLDFLEKYQCLIDFKQKILHIQNYNIKLYNKYDKILTKI